MKVLIVDDYVVMLEFVRMLCQRIGFDVVGAVTSGGAAIDEIQKAKPELVILDLLLPGVSGVKVVESMPGSQPRPKVLVFSGICNEFVVYRVERAIQGYLLKAEATLHELEHAIREIAEGRCYFSSGYLQARSALRQDPGAFSKILTKSELGVLSRVARCQDDAAIANELRISVRTVEKHRSNMARKLGFASRLELERYGRERGFDTV
jgi:DNA-binding NarL/FixJ family response regulator